ncbi:MAG: PorP/SprF family type IX secretion system membrane protein [Lewinellaceae bacterium]|nr:PorP/SprF family type IX secretion system membrane protein [Phaeodactylibacter sp.]MCB0613444.1 PorP/SprF family type IX secretion system membrane protein [Phaeodactylibacter sp.]MCB9351887.1 PorP/SprF family type IX secretion system membrane protein [Lewinellaceae bacterium]
MQHTTPLFAFLAFFAFLLAGGPVTAQDAHFSQFSRTSAYSNPAFVGLSPAPARLALHYRNQWPSVLAGQSYHSALAAFDWRNCFGLSFFAFGVSAQASRAGDSRYTDGQAMLSLAYHQQIDQGFFLAGGVRGGAWNYRIDEGQLAFEEQFDGIGFDPARNNFESFDQLQRTVFGLSAGLLLYDTEAAWQIGASLLHINQPLYSFLEDAQNGNRVGMGWSMQGQFGISTNRSPDSKELALQFFYRQQALFKNSKQRMLSAGGLWQLMENHKGQAFFLGLYGRVARRAGDGNFTFDAITPYMRVDYGDWSFGLSYDVNVSPLATVSRLNGAVELSVQANIGDIRDCIRCPSNW